MQAQNMQEVRRWYLRLLPFLPVLIALVTFAYLMERHSQTLKSETEQEALNSISLSLGLPITATKVEVYARLKAVAQEHEVAQRALIADKVGLDTNWDQIFQRIEKMSPAEQAEALEMITSEYHLPGNMPIGGVKKNVSWRGAFVETAVPPSVRPVPHGPIAVE